MAIVRKAMETKGVHLTSPAVIQAMTNRRSKQFFDTLWVGGPAGKKRPALDVLKSNMWKGKRCFILAGGPSLDGFDFQSLQNELTIGINRVYEFFPECTILFAMDGRFYNWTTRNEYIDNGKRKDTRKLFADFQGMKVWLDMSNHKIKDVFYIRSLGKHGLADTLEGGLFHGNNSGYGAFQLAWALGANPIYLLGYDMKFSKGKGHFHGGHPVKFKPESMQSFPTTFLKMAGKIKASGRTVINCNPQSALKTFKFGEIPADVKPQPKKSIFVSFFTDQIYQQHAAKLRDDLWRHSLRLNVEQIKDQGTWTKNCHKKPEYILKMLDKYPGSPVVWVDCDARVHSYPTLFDELKCDFAAHVRRRRPYTGHHVKSELLSGTLYFANNEKSRALLKLWIAENNRNGAKWDQKNLEIAVKQWNGIQAELPIKYCQIFDAKEKQSNPIIEHFQASRKLRARKHLR